MDDKGILLGWPGAHACGPDAFPWGPPALHCGVLWPPWLLVLGAGGGLPLRMSELLEDKDSGGWGWGSEL